MEPEMTPAVPDGKMPPSVTAGCFDTNRNTMWLSFSDETAAVYSKVPLYVLKKLRSYEGPAEASDYVREHVWGKFGQKPINIMAFNMSMMLGMYPPTE